MTPERLWTEPARASVASIPRLPAGDGGVRMADAARAGKVGDRFTVIPVENR